MCRASHTFPRLAESQLRGRSAFTGEEVECSKGVTCPRSPSPSVVAPKPDSRSPGPTSMVSGGPAAPGKEEHGDLFRGDQTGTSRPGALRLTCFQEPLQKDLKEVATEAPADAHVRDRIKLPKPDWAALQGRSPDTSASCSQRGSQLPPVCPSWPATCRCWAAGLCLMKCPRLSKKKGFFP